MEADGSNPGEPHHGSDPGWTLRVAATADLHVHAAHVEKLRRDFETVDRDADLLLVAGDLTSVGTREEAAMLASAMEAIRIPVVAVLGNHDCHQAESEAVARELELVGIQVLDPGHSVVSVEGVEVGIVGLKGFVGGFAGGHLPDFGEPLLREVYAETGRHVDALDAGLRAVAHCPIRLVVMHYAPVAETLDGEPAAIYPFLGCDRLAIPIREHEPDLVVHGHAHAGRFEGKIGAVPVFNVSVEVTGRAYWVFEVSPARLSTSSIH